MGHSVEGMAGWDELDVTKPVKLPHDVTHISTEDAEYERGRAERASQRKYKVTIGMEGFNPSSTDGKRQLAAERNRYKSRKRK